MGGEHSINLHALKTAIDMVFDDMLRNERLDEVPLSADYYWDLADEELYDVKRELNPEGVGQLTEDGRSSAP